MRFIDFRLFKKQHQRPKKQQRNDYSLTEKCDKNPVKFQANVVEVWMCLLIAGENRMAAENIRYVSAIDGGNGGLEMGDVCRSGSCWQFVVETRRLLPLPGAQKVTDSNQPCGTVGEFGTGDCDGVQEPTIRHEGPHLFADIVWSVVSPAVFDLEHVEENVEVHELANGLVNHIECDHVVDRTWYLILQKCVATGDKPPCTDWVLAEYFVVPCPEY
jgi:hypothetical protein